MGVLYIVATPIGNLSDITERAIHTLKAVDLIAAEDTRHSRHLLNYYHIQTPTISLHNYNEAARSDLLIDRLKSGINIAIISDAGTPLISDPGYGLIRKVCAMNIPVVPVPGPCALITALVASGLPTTQFVFEGFIPPTGLARRKKLMILKEETRTIILYESVHRIVDLITLLVDIFEPERQITIARELTKQFETIHTDTIANTYQWLIKDSNQQKGEFVIIIEGCSEKKEIITSEQKNILNILLNELSVKQATTLASKITGISKKKLYALALDETRLNDRKII